MITQDTARRLCNVFVEIGDCVNAVGLVETELGGADGREIFINFSVCENDEGITIPLEPSIAKEAVERQIEVLRREQTALNRKAAEEARL